MIQNNRGVRAIGERSKKKNPLDAPYLAFAPIDRLILMKRLNVQGYVPLWDRGTLWQSEASRFWNDLAREEQSFPSEQAYTYGFQNEFIYLHKCLYASVWRPYGGATLSLRKVLNAWRRITYCDSYKNMLRFVLKPFGHTRSSSLLLSTNEPHRRLRQRQCTSKRTACWNDDAFRDLPLSLIHI